MNKIFEILVFAFAGFILCGCRSAVVPEENPMTSAYKLVLEHWQSAEKGNCRRGYNIAAVLVDPQGRIQAKELNTVISAQDCTQHAEMRLIQKYIAGKRCFNLKGYSVYTTLEPCAMCTAVMSMAGISRVYYGQSDTFFGKAAERLRMDTKSVGGFSPYPRVSDCILVTSPLQQELEMSFKNSRIKEITRWLATDQAKQIFEKHLRRK